MESKDKQSLFLERPTLHLQLSEDPCMAAVFTRCLLHGLVKSQGRLTQEKLQGICVEMPDVRPDPVRLQRFRDICGDTAGTGTLPLVFPETLFIGLLGKLITAPVFPVSPLGLIHTRQTIDRFRPIEESESLDARCCLDRVTRSDRGIEFLCQITLSSSGETVWQGTVVFFSRAGKARKPGRKEPPRHLPPPLKVRETIDVHERTGLSYAAASGDYNPHHLYPVTARLFGFRQPIAHGMWSLARCISGIEKKGPLPGRVSIRSEFKLPVFLPARVRLGFETVRKPGSDVDAIGFEMLDAEAGLPHVRGSVLFPDGSPPEHVPV